jgi:hypothetical protein
MSDEKSGRTRIRAVISLAPIWITGWLFTIGFLHPMFWKAVLMLLIWPYYLGASLG